jgi:hypothetical protein
VAPFKSNGMIRTPPRRQNCLRKKVLTMQFDISNQTTPGRRYVRWRTDRQFGWRVRSGHHRRGHAIVQGHR